MPPPHWLQRHKPAIGCWCGMSRKRSRLRTEIKKLLKAIQAKEATIQETFKKVVSIIDKTANKKIIHWNKADRLKSRLNEKVRKLAA